MRKNRNAAPGLPGLPFFLTLGILTVIAWILPLRPTVSAKEKRTLETFPEFSLSAVTNGSYFSDISLWFSDTFPGRDGMIMAAQRLEALYGDSSVTVYGNASAGDKIPVPSTPAPETSADPAKPASEPTPTPEPTLTPEPTPTPEPEWGGENPGRRARNARRRHPDRRQCLYLYVFQPVLFGHLRRQCDAGGRSAGSEMPRL